MSQAYFTSSGAAAAALERRIAEPSQISAMSPYVPRRKPLETAKFQKQTVENRVKYLVSEQERYQKKIDWAQA